MIKFRAWDNPTEKYRHTPKGMVTNLYQKLKDRSTAKGYGSLTFSLNDFKLWALNSDEFKRLFEIWEFDNYSKNAKPSVDRINPMKGYVFDNMQWLSWNENYYKGIAEVADKKKKPVEMYKDGQLLGIFKSVQDAQFFLGLKSNGDISDNLRGKRKTVKGYSFRYKFENPELLEVTDNEQ